MPDNKTSISVRVKAGNIEHNNRTFVAKNIIKEKIKDNIIYKQEDIAAAYEKIFSEAVRQYNQKQKQPCRRINNYLEKIKKGKQEKPFYEAIIEFGNKSDTSVGSERGETAKKMLDEYMKDFQERNPHLYVFNAVMHLDEATPHLHIDFIPFATNQTQGPSTRVTLKRALEQQGIFAKNMKETERQQWALKEKKVMRTIAKKHNLIIENKGIHRKHLEIEDYKTFANSPDFNEYKKSFESIPLTEVASIKSENVILRKNLEAAEKKTNVKRKDFYYTSEEKLNYITEKLQSEGIDATIEGEAVRAPEWAEEHIKELEQSYKPKPLTWREKLKLDIDRLIYAVKNTDELWKVLRSNGYEVKTGKYISIKPNGAERFIRTKSLSYEYSLESIEKRIANNRNFEKGCIDKINNTTGIEKDFHIAVKNVVIIFYSQRKIPKKIKQDKPFTIKNDCHIVELKSYLDLIKSENIHSSIDLDDKREKCEEKITEVEKRIEEIDAMQDAVADIKEKAKLYFNQENFGKMSVLLEKKIAVAKETLDDYGIQSEKDLFKVNKAFERNWQEKETLLEIIKSEKTRLSELSKLFDIHGQIRDGSYINRLINEELKYRDDDKQQINANSELKNTGKKH